MLAGSFQKERKRGTIEPEASDSMRTGMVLGDVRAGRSKICEVPGAMGHVGQKHENKRL